jgi:hypothetical protein
MVSLSSLPPSVTSPVFSKNVSEMAATVPGRPGGDPPEAKGAPQDVPLDGIRNTGVASHNPVLWPLQIDPVAVHAAVLIAQETYRNQKALEGLAVLMQAGLVLNVPPGQAADKVAARNDVRPVSTADNRRDHGDDRSS